MDSRFRSSVSLRIVLLRMRRRGTGSWSGRRLAGRQGLSMVSEKCQEVVNGEKLL